MMGQWFGDVMGDWFGALEAPPVGPPIAGTGRRYVHDTYFNTAVDVDRYTFDTGA